MANNMAKRMATMTLLYWKPIVTGSGTRYESPVKFSGFYIGNASVDDGGPSGVIAAAGGMRDNLVLFYMCQPEADGYVCWDTTLEALQDEGLAEVSPAELPSTHKIKSVNEYVMPRSKNAVLQNKAFIASVV